MAFDPTQIPGHTFYHSKDPKDIDYQIKNKTQCKFPKKYLVWQAIDEFGNVSESYISDGPLDSKTYLKECIKARLIPFILQYHEIENILFWPDPASIHYAKIVTDYLTQKKIEFVAKSKNPPNVPQARGIEMMWSNYKRKYSVLPTAPKNLVGFKLIWARISTETAAEIGKRCMKHAYKNLIKIGYKGVAGGTGSIS